MNLLNIIWIICVFHIFFKQNGRRGSKREGLYHWHWAPCFGPLAVLRLISYFVFSRHPGTEGQLFTSGCFLPWCSRWKENQNSSTCFCLQVCFLRWWVGVLTKTNSESDMLPFLEWKRGIWRYHPNMSSQEAGKYMLFALYLESFWVYYFFHLAAGWTFPLHFQNPTAIPPAVCDTDAFFKFNINKSIKLWNRCLLRFTMVF